MGSDPLDQIRSGDETAFRDLVGSLHGRLVRLARTFVREEGIAEEVAQETWLAVLEGIRRFEGRSSLRTWIFGILVNRAKTRAMRDRREVTEGVGLESPEDREDDHRFHVRGVWRNAPTEWEDSGPESGALRKELAGALDRALAELPDRLRQVALLRDGEGFETAEVAAALGIEEVHVRVLLHRARIRLRKALERYHKGVKE